MADSATARIVRRKARRTARLRRIDLRHQARRGITNDTPARTVRRYRPPRKTVLRAALYRDDLLLEAAGVLAPLNVAGLWEDGWLVGAVRMPGVNADYRGGRVILDGAVVHYTVGTDSRGPGLRGLFPFLLARDGTIYQFGQVLGVFWHACEFNGRTVGVETELAVIDGVVELVTDAQVASWGRVLAGLWALGMPRLGPEGLYRNNVHDVDAGVDVLPQPLLSHRTLIHRACDPHQDFLPDEIIARVAAIAAGLLGEGSDDRRRKVATL